MLVTTTNAFDKADLLDGAGNGDHHPRRAGQLRQHPGRPISADNGAPPPDATTLATGDAGKRVACGVIGAG